MATIVLPPGPVRGRYRQEFLADLYVFDRRARLGFAIGLLVNAFALRAAVGGDEAPVTERDFALVPRPLLCRLHLHLRVRCINADREVYHRCRRCGDDQYEYELHPDSRNVAGAVIGGSFSTGC